MNSKEIFNIIIELSRMQEAELVKHNKSLAEQLSNTKPKEQLHKNNANVQSKHCKMRVTTHPM